jgi:murein DD-endopeptidase MepM/ murein hydrolase activator NlpD
MPLLAQLKKETEQQKIQFIYLAERIHQMNQKMKELRDFDHRLKVMANLKMSSNDTQLQGIGGSDPDLFRSSTSLPKTHRELILLLHQSLENLNEEIALTRKEKSEIHKFFENQRLLLASTPSIWPCRGWLSSSFGYRISPFTGERELHKGIDIAAKMNASVVAPADGIVSSIRRKRMAGKVLFIKHGYGLRTKYAHLQKATVKEGQYVKRGEKIALVGNSGRTTGPHLHYEVHLKGVPVNPLNYILAEPKSQIFTH